VSEYFRVETERTENPDVLEIITSETLTQGEEEVYENPQAGNVGSTLAQTLFHGVDGIKALTIADDTLIVTRQPGVVWEILVDEVRDVLRDFFL